jgi:hypothetical protein
VERPAATEGDMEQLVKRIVALSEERLAILNDYDPMTFAVKRARVHDLDAKIAALFVQKRAMSVARYTKNDY